MKNKPFDSPSTLKLGYSLRVYTEPRQRRGRMYKGFTLIEILLVILLLTIVIGITIPNFSSSHKTLLLRTTVDHLAYLMRYAQSRAVAASREIHLEFNNDLSQYWLTEGPPREDDSDTAAGNSSFERLHGRFGQSFDIPEGITIKIEDGLGVSFYPDGRIEKKHIVVCRDETCFTVSTQEQRGYVQIYPPSQKTTAF